MIVTESGNNGLEGLVMPSAGGREYLNCLVNMNIQEYIRLVRHVQIAIPGQADLWSTMQRCSNTRTSRLTQILIIPGHFQQYLH